MSRKPPDRQSPHSVDILVGNRIRMRRAQKSISQTSLGAALGVSFQQVQKYEKGTNRVSCSRLVEIAQVLDVSVSYFFQEGRSDPDISAVQQLDARDFKYGMRLIAAFGQVSDRSTRQKFLELLETIAASQISRRG
jgi:transcriptional regulator with XRE-family HTH domain